VLRKRGERTGRGKDTHKLTSQARILYIIISEEERRIDRLIFTFKNSRICFSSHTQRVERERRKKGFYMSSVMDSVCSVLVVWHTHKRV